MESLGFSNFRQLMDQWDETADGMNKDQVKSIIEGGGFIFFFEKGNELFAAPESSRVAFATMKHPDDDMPKTWAQEAAFTALNLSRALEGTPIKSVFNYKDLDDIHVKKDDEMYDLLMSKIKDLPSGKINLQKAIRDEEDREEPDAPEDAPDNMNKIGEK